MGGKHKVANRTKNNARPSSSGRSAEFLGSSVPQFIGFSGLKDTGVGISLTTKDELEAALDPNIQLVLKKISKKDATTKIKGLQELTETIKNTEPESVKALLPVWPRFYNVLATDVDNRVREAVHKTHHQLVLKVKRNIAPYLKQLMAPWFTSQYDTYPPAASAASQAFSDAFSPNKYTEAIMFCQEEIVAYISENILNLSTQSSAIYKNLTAEEAEAKFDRVLISCLQGYNLYLEQVPKECILKSLEANNNIVSNGKFWKLAKNNVVQVRAAWFKVLTVICQKAEVLLKGREKEVTNTVFNSLDESDPTVLPYVWEATLMIMSSLKDWWKYVNVEKVLFPKLMKILKHGGQGNATALYPNLLPLLSHLPPSIRENESEYPDFYKKIFENLRLGMTQKSTLASRSETLAITTAFTECLQYLISTNYDNESFCKTLISSQLMPMLNWCLIEDVSCFKSVCKQIAGLVQSWSRNCDKSEVFQKYLIFFFEFTAETFIGMFQEDATAVNDGENTRIDVIALTDKQLEFLHCLKQVPRPKRKGQVKFAEAQTGATKENIVSSNSSVHSDEKYIGFLNNLVYKLCERYVEYINLNYRKQLFGNLYSLVSEFDTFGVFNKLIEKMKITNPEATFYSIYQNILEMWFKTQDYNCKHVVDLIFLLFKFIKDEEKETILKSLIQNGTEESLGWCISEALAFPHNTDPVIKKWLQTSNVNNYLVSIVDKQITNSCTSELTVLLKLALTENGDGELWIQQEALTKIIEKVIGVIENFKSYPLSADHCTSLACYISTLVYTENYLLHFGNSLLLALFKLSCNPVLDKEIISVETIYETSTAWQDAISLLTDKLNLENSKELTGKFAEIFEEFFQSACLEENQLSHLSNVLCNFLRAVHRSKPLAMTDFLSVFLDQPFFKIWTSEIHNLCKNSELVKGNLSSPYEKVDSTSNNLQEINCGKYFAAVYLIIGTVGSKLDDIEEEIDDDDEDGFNEEEKKPVILLNVLDNPENLFADLLYEQEVCQTYLETFKNTKYYDKILNYFVLMEHKIQSILDTVDNTFKSTLRTILKDKSLSEAWFWSKVVYTIHKNASSGELAKVYSAYTNSAREEHKLGVIHLTQVFKNHLTYDYVQKGFDNVMDIIILKCLIHCEDIDVQIAEVWMKIEKIRNDDPDYFHRMNTHEKLSTIIETFRLYTAWIQHKFDSVTPKQWDFGMLLMATWGSYFLNIRQNYENYEVQELLCTVVKLFVTTDQKVKSLKAQNITVSHISDWEDVLFEGIHDDLAVMWMYLSEQLEDKRHISYLPLIQEFGIIVQSISQKYIFRINQTLPKWTKFLKRSCSLLTNPQPSLQIWGYKMLLVLIPGLVKIDNESVDTNTPHKKGLIFEQFKEKLVELHDIVNTMLMGFKLGEDSCRVESSTDSFIYTFAYLLLWDVLLTLCEQASTELRYQYADWLRNEDMLKNFLNNLFRLMPTEVLQYSEGKSKSVLEMFLKKPDIHMDERCDGEKIEVLVCWLYSSTLSQLPALVRQWWTSLDAKITQIVERVTSLYVSPNLINQELSEVLKYQNKFKNMVIKTVPTARELIAIYTVDEAQVDLLISLPTNYPLGGLEVQCNKQIGGSSHKQWLLQFKKCVLHQNGRIWDGLSLWNNNLDKRFDGVEECYICFAVLHPGTYQLPKLSCQTCKKKFHSACLYKWFRTSYKSSCPICRNLF